MRTFPWKSYEKIPFTITLIEKKLIFHFNDIVIPGTIYINSATLVTKIIQIKDECLLNKDMRLNEVEW